jgi:ABC-type dipeptide/oligopeptide/nickel transport system permease component
VTTGLARFVARRVAVAVLFVLVVSAASFVLARLAPGDAVSELALSGAGADAMAAARARLGLDRTLPAQVAAWLGGLARLDLGQSSRFNRPVAGLVGERMRNTARLAAAAALLAAGIGLPLGVLTGSRPRSALAGAVTVVSTGLLCCPPIAGTLGLLFLGASTGWLSISPGHLALPTLALALPLAARLERLQSQAISDALASPALVAAAARGIPHARLVWVHAWRQALRPILGVAGLIVATLFSGSIAVETITAWPGLGRLMLDALTGRDLYLVAGCALAGAALVAAGNLAADLARAGVDPTAGRTA